MRYSSHIIITGYLCCGKLFLCCCCFSFGKSDEVFQSFLWKVFFFFFFFFFSSGNQKWYSSHIITGYLCCGRFFFFLSFLFFPFLFNFFPVFLFSFPSIIMFPFYFSQLFVRPIWQYSTCNTYIIQNSTVFYGHDLGALRWWSPTTIFAYQPSTLSIPPS